MLVELMHLCMNWLADFPLPGPPFPGTLGTIQKRTRWIRVAWSALRGTFSEPWQEWRSQRRRVNRGANFCRYRGVLWERKP